MNIGKNIYTLRKEKKITQAQLAEKLGVSEQAVSKWENDQCAPDVSLFPLLAEFFGVSIDRLFGYYMNSHEEEIKAIIQAADDSMDTYKEIEILTEGLNKYPNSPELKINLAFSLSMVNRISQDQAEKAAAIKKAIKICTEVVDHCGDCKQTDRALNMLNRIYSEIGEYGKAMAAIEKMSGESYYFRVVGMARTLAHKHDDQELEKYVEKNLFDCWLAMDINLDMLTSRFSENEQFDKSIAFCKLMTAAPTFTPRTSSLPHFCLHTHTERRATRQRVLKPFTALLHCLSRWKRLHRLTTTASAHATPCILHT